MEKKLILKKVSANTLKPSNIHIWAVSFLVVMLISLFGTGMNSASADAGVTIQTTGASVNDPIDPTQIQYQPGDVNPPILVDFSFSPTVIDTSSGPATITVTIEATDDISGLCLSICSDGSSMTQARFEHPATGQFRDAIFTLASGTINDGIFKSEITFVEGSARGKWEVTSILMVDDLGNRSYESVEGLTDLQVNEAQVDVEHSVIDANGEESTAVLSSSEGGLNKAYTRFEIHQVAKINLVGTFEVVGDGFNSVTPYSAASGDQLSVYTIFPESTGRYQVWLKADGYDEPVIWVEGELERISEGKYRHQLIGGKANPDVFELTPGEPGMMIALGSVRAKLNSCVLFFSPTNAVFELGVDANGDGLIDPLESVTQQINGQSQTCIGTPESNIPLTSHYRSVVTAQDGTLIARNEGLYDFLNKSSMNSEKEAHPEFVKEFKLQWIRTPVATSIKVMNSALRAPADHVEVVPQVEEVTGDIIRNGSDSDTTPIIAGDGSSPSNTDGTGSSQSGGSSETGIPSDPGSSVIDNNPLNFILENWMLLALGAGLAFAAYLILRGVTSTGSLSYQNA